MTLLLLNTFHRLLWCFRCWLLAIKFRLNTLFLPIWYLKVVMFLLILENNMSDIIIIIIIILFWHRAKLVGHHFSKVDQTFFAPVDSYSQLVVFHQPLHLSQYADFFFFYLGCLSRTFTIHRIAEEGAGYLFKGALMQIWKSINIFVFIWK